MSIIPSLFFMVFILVYGDVSDHYFSGVILPIGPDNYNVLDNYKNSLKKYVEGDVKALKDSRLKVHENVKEIYRLYKEISGVFASTSRFYYNYRHVGNVFCVLSQFNKHGLVTNRNIVTLLPETCLCHPTNTAAGRIYVTSSVETELYEGPIDGDTPNVYLDGTLITHKGYNCTKDLLRYSITNRYPKKYPNGSKLPRYYGRNDRVRRMFYYTGHGGDSYLQFQAKDFISSLELSNYYKELYMKDPIAKVFTILDTCQASTMFERMEMEMPQLWLASSLRGRSSYSHNPNYHISVSTVDKFTFCLYGFLNSVLTGVLSRRGKVSLSRLSFNQLLRFIERNLTDEKIKYSVSKNADPNDKKIYIGQFIFNYRIAHFSSYIFPLDRIPQTTDISSHLSDTISEIANEVRSSAGVRWGNESLDRNVHEKMILNGLYERNVLLKDNEHGLYSQIFIMALITLLILAHDKLF